MTKLHFTHCKKCKSDYLVGVDEKDISVSQMSGGEMFLTISNDEIEKAPIIKDKIPCKNCGNICKVEEAK